MIADELKYRIRAAFGYEPTEEQQEAINGSYWPCR